MKRKGLRVCAACGVSIAEQRPVYLVVDPSQSIRGPFHSGCAERELMYARKAILRRDTGYTTFEEFGKVITVRAQDEDLHTDQEDAR